MNVQQRQTSPKRRWRKPASVQQQGQPLRRPSHAGAAAASRALLGTSLRRSSAGAEQRRSNAGGFGSAHTGGGSRCRFPTKFWRCSLIRFGKENV